MGWMGLDENSSSLWPSILSHRRQPPASRAPGPDQALQDAYLHGARLRRVGNAPGRPLRNGQGGTSGEDTSNVAGGSILFRPTGLLKVQIYKFGVGRCCDHHQLQHTATPSPSLARPRASRGAQSRGGEDSYSREDGDAPDL
jgi:hypothetical protein